MTRLLTLTTTQKFPPQAEDACNLDCDVRALLRQWRGEALGLGYESDGATVTLRSDNQARSVQGRKLLSCSEFVKSWVKESTWLLIGSLF